MSRYIAREGAFLLVFEQEFQPELTTRQLMDAYFANEENPQPGAEESYMQDLLEGVVSHKAELDEIIEQNSKGWKKNRLSKTAIAVLRVALYEILYREDVGHGTSINEAVELLKKYDTEETARFVNGLLGGFIKSREGKE
jgi:N utilization substance protein B